MKIRVKLLSGFGFYVLFALVLGVFAYGQLRTITTRLGTVETADDLTNTMLEVRRYEKNYLLFRDEESSRSLKQYLGSLRKGVDRIEEETRSEIPPSSYAAMKVVIGEYETIFDELVGILKREEQARRNILATGDRIGSGPQELEGTVLLEFREREKRFLEEKSAAAHDRLLAGLKALSLARPGEAAAYRALVDEASDLYRMENATLERLRTTARDIQALAESLSRRERTAVETLLRHAERSVRLLLLAIAAAVAVGVVIDAQLARSIATPIRKLEDLTQKIAAGDLSERINVRGEDEFSALGRSFNQMQDRLHDTLTTLELANEDLRTNRVRLGEAEKFASLGRFSAGVAHEINNPLAVISEKAGLMKDYLALAAEFPDRERFAGLLEAIGENVARCSSITHRILDYTSTAAVDPEAVHINRILGELLKAFERRLLAKHVRLTLDLVPDLPVVRAGRAQVRQVLSDIVKHRVDAAATGGLLRVSTGMKDAGTLQVSIWDNGPPLPPETLEHLFEPFSTARETGKDPGLGLWISHGLIRKVGGNLLVSSEPSRGTTFTMEIPVPAAASGAEPA